MKISCTPYCHAQKLFACSIVIMQYIYKYMLNIMCSTWYLDVQTDTLVLICCYTLYTVCNFQHCCYGFCYCNYCCVIWSVLAQFFFRINKNVINNKVNKVLSYRIFVHV